MTGLEITLDDDMILDGRHYLVINKVLGSHFVIPFKLRKSHGFL
jgi:hypothetical protein